jgi:hypothetical protein
MPNISQQQLQEIFNKADSSGQKLDRSEIVQELVNRGHIIEGLNDPRPEKQKGFFGTVFDSLKKRNQAAFGTDTGLVSAVAGDINTNSAVGRFATGQQSGLETGLQIAGQGAGAIGDVVGAGLASVGRGISAVTPEAIKTPIKNAGLSVLQSPVGQAGITALQNGMESYGEWKKSNPVIAADLEAVVNLASLVPIGKVSQAGKQGLTSIGISKVDDVLGGASKGLRESAEASVSKVLNPTTQATKQTTKKIAGELVDRPLSDTLALTRKGMQAKAGAAAELAGQSIDDAGKLAGKTNTSELINFLQSQKQQFMAGGKVVNREGIQSIDEVTQLIAQYGDDVGNETLRDIRKIFDAEFFQGKKNIAKSAAETSTLNFKKQAADKIRGILGEKFPDVAKLNKEYTFWTNLEDVLGKTVARKTGQKQFLKAVATIGGATTGTSVSSKVVGALGFNLIASLVDSPAWGFLSAKAKNRLAQALANSDISEIGKVLGSLPGLTAAQALPDQVDGQSDDDR